MPLVLWPACRQFGRILRGHVPLGAAPRGPAAEPIRVSKLLLQSTLDFEPALVIAVGFGDRRLLLRPRLGVHPAAK